MKGFIKNPGFELGDQDWNKSAGWTIVNDVVNSRSGAWVAKLTPQASAFLLSNQSTVRPGSSISVSGWWKHSATYDATTKVGILWRDKDGAEISRNDSPVIPAGTVAYTEALITGIAPDKAKTAEIIALTAAATLGLAYFDDADASGDVIESLPATVHIESSKIIRSETLAAFNPLIGNTVFNDFNAGKSDRWAGVFTLMPDIPSGDLGELLGWLALVGKTERFFAFDPNRQIPKLGIVNGLLVDGGSQQGTSINVKGGPISTANVLVAGDYVEVRAQYFRLTRNLDIGPEGTGVMQVWPAIRTAPVTDEPVITDHPKMVARITSPIPEETTVYTRITFSWEEFI